MSNSGNEANLPIETEIRQRQPGKKESPPQRLPPYHVVLLNDDDHTYDYVIEMLGTLFGYNATKGFLMADQLNPHGRVIVLTTHKEHAELKRDQIHAFGRDRRLDRCRGSMSAVIEPAQ
ncbi:MAG TPA: ATP-dependent Clp protease adaptor ClpS [Tepidisphaeraceae bacterium]|jgi:ATP-dependent Clp protease adaptor protein ClpS|nr:ATP-dependent Clp protease adaptor ClpS [Tepidisphaeraceae bacterium]